MSGPGRSHPLAWLPPFLVGAAAAVGAETAVGLLLYSGNGFLRALTLIVATLLAALAVGLWSAPPPGADGMVEALRRRWLVTLVAFTLAAVGAATWSLLDGFSEGVLTRGLGLALLGAVPLYAVGALLGTMGAHRAALELRGPASAAAAGAALGAVGTGFLLTRTVAPFAMHVFVLILLSGGALVHGRVLDRSAAARDPEEGAVGQGMDDAGGSESVTPPDGAGAAPADRAVPPSEGGAS